MHRSYNVLGLLCDKVNDVLSFVDHLLLPVATNDAPFLFIVGPPRSGTTLAYQIIASQFKVGYISAPYGYLYGMPLLLTRILAKRQQNYNQGFGSEYGKINGLLSPSEHASFWFRWFPRDSGTGHYVRSEKADLLQYQTLRQILNGMAAIHGCPMVFKNLYLSMVTGILAQLLPNSFFVIVSRDPVLTCQSILLARRHNKKEQQWWSIKTPNYNSLLHMPSWLQVTEQIFYTLYILRNETARYAVNRHIEISYEGLCRNPHSIVSDLQQRLSSLNIMRREHSYLPKYFPVSDKLNLSTETIKDIRAHWNYLAASHNT